jgi:hypothetical protein
MWQNSQVSPLMEDGAHRAVLRAVDVPVAAHDIALDDALRRRPVFTRFAELVEFEGDEKIGHWVPVRRGLMVGQC